MVGVHLRLGSLPLYSSPCRVHTPEPFHAIHPPCGPSNQSSSARSSLNKSRAASTWAAGKETSYSAMYCLKPGESTTLSPQSSAYSALSAWTADCSHREAKSMASARSAKSSSRGTRLSSPTGILLPIPIAMSRSRSASSLTSLGNAGTAGSGPPPGRRFRAQSSTSSLSVLRRSSSPAFQSGSLPKARRAADTGTSTESSGV
jgi:hypothetical protein